MFELPQQEIYQNKSNEAPIQKTLSPVVVGGSVIGLFFKDGVMIATDCGATYGSVKMFPNIERIEKINDHVVLASNGEVSDFQEVVRLLSDLNKKDVIYDDNIQHTPKDFANYLAKIHYEKRNKLNPYYLFNVLGGISNGKRYLAGVDLYGTLIESNWAATGFAGYLCKPLIYNYWNENMSEEETKAILLECFKVLAYRNTRAFEKIVISTIDANGVRVSEPIKLSTKWDFEDFKNRANEKLHSDKRFY